MARMKAQRAPVAPGGGRAGAAPRAPRRRLAMLAAAAALAAAGVLAGLLASSGAAGPPATAAGHVTSGSLVAFRTAMIAKLRDDRMHFFWVVCVRSGAHFHGAAVVRCNVDFGDPHIQAYCSVFRGGRLVTSADDRAIPCRPDDAGYTQTIQTYS
jgi:hypothetical protein